MNNIQLINKSLYNNNKLFWNNGRKMRKRQKKKYSQKKMKRAAQLLKVKFKDSNNLDRNKN